MATCINNDDTGGEGTKLMQHTIARGSRTSKAVLDNDVGRTASVLFDIVLLAVSLFSASSNLWHRCCCVAPTLLMADGRKGFPAEKCKSAQDEPTHSVSLKRLKHSLRMGWRNFFSSCAVVSVFGSGGK